MDIYPDTGMVFPAALTYYFDEIRYDNIPCALPATANAGTDQSICAGSSAALVGVKTNATGVIWSGGTGTFTQVLQHFQLPIHHQPLKYQQDLPL